MGSILTPLTILEKMGEWQAIATKSPFEKGGFKGI
jgi:hypothetical protein